MVSVIVPVYNVEDYVDRCLESIVNQTHTDIEILVMEAKSSDNSLQKVIDWAKKDDRITIVSRKDGGLGPGRNFGLSIARGEYVVFVDSDDWISYDFIEKTLEVAESDKDIDLVQADVVIYDGNNPRNKKNKTKDVVFEGLKAKEILMCYGDNSMWGKLYRKSLFIENRIAQPGLPCEDLAVYPGLIAKSRKIATCYQATAFYQSGREGSLFQISNSYKKFPEIMAWARNTLSRLNEFDRYKEVFSFMMYRHFRNTTIHCIGREKYEDLKRESPEMYEFECSQFQAYKNVSYWVFGSFTLRWIAHRFIEGKSGLKHHFSFTGLIGQMTSAKSEKEIKHADGFRMNAINSDYQGTFAQIDNKYTFPMCILVDFLQECNNVIMLKDNNYITDSIALRESDFDNKNIKKIVLWNSQEFWELWKKKCSLFIQKIECYPSDVKIVLVRNWYVTQYMEKGKLCTYENITDINNRNRMLEKMYSFFIKNCSRVKVFDGDETLLYTDVSNQLYNPEPEYINSLYYTDLSMRIELNLMRERGEKNAV